MALNPKASKFIKGKIEEIRDFYLRIDTAEDIPLEDVIDGIQDILVEERKAEAAVEEREGEGAEEEAGLEEIPLEEIKEKALTTLQIINEMSISERIRLALTGSRTERAILIKDRNKVVTEAVIHSPKITQDEIGLIVRDRSIPGEIIAHIARNREWTKNYTIITELLQNPKTPVKDALGFIKKLHIRDLKLLTTNKNANPVVRTLAVNYYQQKTQKKP